MSSSERPRTSWPKFFICTEVRPTCSRLQVLARYLLLGSVNTRVELQPDKFQEYYNAVNQRIAQLLVISQESNDKIRGIVAI